MNRDPLQAALEALVAKLERQARREPEVFRFHLECARNSLDVHLKEKALGQ